MDDYSHNITDDKTRLHWFDKKLGTIKLPAQRQCRHLANKWLEKRWPPPSDMLALETSTLNEFYGKKNASAAVINAHAHIVVSTYYTLILSLPFPVRQAALHRTTVPQTLRAEK